MVLPDREAVLGFDAFLGNAGPDHFGQSIEIEGIDTHAPFDFGSNAFGPGLGPQGADAEPALARLDPLPLELVGDRQHVAWRHHDDVRPENANELDWAFGKAPANWNDRRAQPLSAVVRAQPTGEQAIAIGHVNL